MLFMSVVYLTYTYTSITTWDLCLYCFKNCDEAKVFMTTSHLTKHKKDTTKIPDTKANVSL